MASYISIIPSDIMFDILKKIDNKSLYNFFLTYYDNSLISSLQDFWKKRYSFEYKKEHEYVINTKEIINWKNEYKNIMQNTSKIWIMGEGGLPATFKEIPNIRAKKVTYTQEKFLIIDNFDNFIIGTFPFGRKRYDINLEYITNPLFGKDSVHEKYVFSGKIPSFADTLSEIAKEDP